jgi:hypothetical protein
VTGIDERTLRRRLREELGGLPVQPVPITAVTGRGRAVRARRRLTAAAAAAVAAAVAALLAIPALLPGGGLAGNPAVTMSAPDPAAPGGVFASGTYYGKPWRLAVRDISGQGRACVPAVMLNGHHGDLLSRTVSTATAVGYPAFLTLLPGLRRVGFGFVAVRPGVTSVAVKLADGESVTAQTVAVTRCGERFRLAGFAYADSNPTGITAFAGARRAGTSIVGPVPFTARAGVVAAGPSTGLWENTPAGGKRPVITVGLAGKGTVGRATATSVHWQIRVVLGGGACRGTGGVGPGGTGWTSCWTGDCFYATAAASSGLYQWQSQTCLAIEAPPRAARLTQVPAIGSPETKDQPLGPELTAYAGLVSPRTAHVMAYFSNGAVRRLTPGTGAGRKYIGLAMAKQVLVTRLVLYDAARHPFATVLRMPGSCGVQPIPACGTYVPR